MQGENHFLHWSTCQCLNFAGHRLKIKRNDWLLADTTCVRKQPIIALNFESETELKFYNLEAWSQTFQCFLTLRAICIYQKQFLVGSCLMLVLGLAHHCLASGSVALVHYSRVYHCQLFWSCIMYSTSKIVHLKYVFFFSCNAMAV